MYCPGLVSTVILDHMATHAVSALPSVAWPEIVIIIMKN